MNKIAKFFHEFLHPHCEHCDAEKVETTNCDSCDTLRAQLEIVNHEKLEILNRLLDKEAPVYKETVTARVEKPRPRPWPVVRQELEKEDRIKARAIQAAAKADPVVEKIPEKVPSIELGIEELEKEIFTNEVKENATRNS